MALPFSSFHSWLSKSPFFHSNPNPSPSPNPSPNSLNHPSGTHSTFPVSSTDSFAALDAIDLSRSPSEKNSGGQKACSTGRRRANKGVRQLRRNQSLDLDFDMVVVQPDYYSGSESEGSDWSVGWFEPHAPEFCSDGEPENSFAVLVPCYGAPSPDTFGGKTNWFGQEETVNPPRSTNSKSQLWAAVLSNIAKDSQAETNFYLQQWVSSLQT